VRVLNASTERNNVGNVISKPLPLSVVVSVRDSVQTLREVLAAILASELPRHSYEIIVVDDVSTDDSVGIAARYADTIVKLSGRPTGPAYARNRGVELSRGQVIAFVDDDVVICPDTLPRMLTALIERPDLDASGCGLVRRAAFLAAGMYDEWRFGTACLESVELGERLSRGGRGVLLSADVQVTHLRRWDISSISREVWRRGGLLTRSLGYLRISEAAPSEVVFTLSRALTPAVALLSTLMLAAAFVPAPSAAARGAVALMVLLLTNMPVHRYYARAQGLGFAIMSAPLHLFTQTVAALALCSGWILRDVLGDVTPDATTQAYSEVGLEVWPPIPRKR
jgi:Glycosyl transferase family 2